MNPQGVSEETMQGAKNVWDTCSRFRDWELASDWYFGGSIWHRFGTADYTFLRWMAELCKALHEYDKANGRVAA